jgi:hypothetical protein
MRIKITTFIGVLLILHTTVWAHPTGNMIAVGKHVLWSYIYPIDDPNHHACVMMWKDGLEPEVLVQSAYPASDYMLYTNGKDIYAVERKYSEAKDQFDVRVLKFAIGVEPIVIWDWFKDEYRIGEGGFFMLSDHQMVFGKYPEVYRFEKGEEPQIYFEFHEPIKGIRAVEKNLILLQSDDSCYLAEQDGTILKKWDELTDPRVENAPLNRNTVFDADYHQGALLLSYWGNRSFDLIDKNGRRQILLKQSEPLAPHWVAFRESEKFLFSSSLIFDGSTPKPYLVLIDEKNERRVIWDAK